MSGISNIGIRTGIGVGLSRQSLAAYWSTRYISALSVVTTSDTTQIITATIVGTGYDGVSYEYSTDGVNYTEKGTAIGGTYNAIGLTADTIYYWRARLYKGSHYGVYSNIASERTWTLLYEITNNIAASWVESNREGIGCNYYLISQVIDNDYKNYLINNLIIQI